MNIYDISKKAGVSIATVSRVLNNNSKVSEKTRQKVLSIMEESDYQPNAFARGLTLNTMKTIGLLCADSSDPYLGHAIAHLEQQLRAHNYDSLLCCTGYEMPQKKKCLENLLSRHVDALILIGSNFIGKTKSQNAYLYKAAKQVPLILLNGYLPGDHIYSVLCDDADATGQAVQRLLADGFKNPLFLYRADSYSGQKKKEGFTRILAQHHCLREENVMLFNGTIQETQEALSSLYMKFPFDCVLASDDELAIGALKFAQKHQLSVPDACSIIGYNNSKLSLCSNPELTSIDNRLDYLCNATVTVLMDLMDNKPAPEKTVFSATIVTRGTTSHTF